MTAFFGKYRGTVTGNSDPRDLGRIQVRCPAVLGAGRSSWAMPCVPYAGPGVGLYAIPPLGANVWVEFEGGDPDAPIWSGCFWGAGELPVTPGAPTTTAFRTPGITVTVDDRQGGAGVTVRAEPPLVPAPAVLALTSSGIELSVGASKIVLSGTSVAVNDGALEVI